MASIENCYLIDLPKKDDIRGSLSFAESCNHVPFAIDRIYYLYDIPKGGERGAHAHKVLEQVMIAISGHFKITLDDGDKRETFVLDKKNQGLFIPKMIWRDMFNFSRDAVCLVLASEYFDEKDYIRDYDEFLSLAHSYES